MRPIHLTIAFTVLTWIAFPFAPAKSVEAGVLVISGPQFYTTPYPGPGTITKQVNLSGLEWIDWNETTSKSVAQVVAEMGPGGMYEGFRYATRSEFEALFDSLWGGTNEVGHESNVPGARWLTDNFLSNNDLLGYNIAFGTTGPTLGTKFWGRFEYDPKFDEATFTNSKGLSLGTTGPPNLQDEASTNPSVFQFDVHALVRISAIPEPATLTIFGMICLVGCGRQRRKQF